MDILTILLLVLPCFPTEVWSHARLMSPPSRSSMWRVGFPTKKNFNDNALYCGGIGVQWQRNGGKCGICGDPYNMPHPRDNEAGGKYGRGIISKRYISGQVIDATVDVTTNHRGYFEFKLCPNNNPKKEATQECLDKYVLKEAHGTGIRYYIGHLGRGYITVKLQLPKGLTCSQCVFQWTYVAGNNWGRCEDGESRLGCGPQETFRGCADIAIEKSTDVFNFKDNDVDKKPHDNKSHKNRKEEHSKDISGPKNIDYAYEVSRRTRMNSSTAVHGQQPSNDDDNNVFHRKKGDNLPSSPQIPRSSKTNTSAKDGNDYDYSNKRRYHRYDNRHFNLYLNQTPINSNLSDSRTSVENNWHANAEKSVAGNQSLHVKNYKAERPWKLYLQRNYTAFNDSNNEFDISREFNLGGKRYRDFWLL